MRAAHLFNHQRGPVEVFASAEGGPIDGREIAEVAEVGGLVGQRDQLGPVRDVGGVLHLLAFAFGLGQGLVVADRFNVGQYLCAEAFLQQLAGTIGTLARAQLQVD